MSFPISEEQQMLVDMVRGFCETELYPHEDLVEQMDDVPAEIAQDIQRKAIELGLYAANMPEKFGGGGLDALSQYFAGLRGRADRALSHPHHQG